MRGNPMSIPNRAKWNKRTVGSLAYIVSRGTAPSYVDSSEFRVIGQRCITANGFDPSWSRPHDPTKMSSMLVPRSGDVLINSTGTGTIGRSSVFPGGDGFAVDGHITLVRVHQDQVDPGWFNAVLQSSWGQSHLENQCYSGSTNQVELSRARLVGTEIPVPSLGEQRRIAEMLEEMDAAIEETTDVASKYASLKQGVVDTLFSERWAWRKGALKEFLVGAPKNGFSPSEVDDWTGVRVLGLGCLTTDGFSPRQLKNVPYGCSSVSSAVLSDGDLLLSRANTRDLVGLAGRYRSVGGVCLYPDLMMRLLPNGQVLSDFMEYSLRHSYMRRQIMASAVGTSESMVKISSEIVRNMDFYVPSLEEQRRIVSIIEAHDERIAAERARLEKLRKLKAGLMDDLLTGRVRVNQLKDLPV